MTRFRNILKQIDLLYALLLVGLSFFISLTFTITPWRVIEPLTDSSVFRYVGLVMDRGGMPYLNTFDHKGPLIYLINWLGIRISFWQGIWFLEFASMLATVSIMYVTARRFASRAWSLVCVIVVMSLLKQFLMGGNFVEEWALPFIAYGTWCTCSVALGDKPNRVRPITTGACFGAVLLMRPNMVAVWAAYVAVVVWQGVSQRDARLVAREAGLFACGTLLIVLPAIVWLYAKGAFDAFVNDYLTFNVTYSKGAKSAFSQMRGRVNALTLFASMPVIAASIVLGAIAWRQGKPCARACVLALTLSLLSVSLSGFGFKHYGMVLLPPASAAIACSLAKADGEGERSRLSACSLPTAILACVLVFSCAPALKAMTDDAMDQRPKDPASGLLEGEFGEAVRLIQENTGAEDSITVCGNRDSLYLASGRASSSRYSYQSPIGEVDKSIDDAYFEDLEANKPAAVVLMKDFYAKERIATFLEDIGYRKVGSTSKELATVWTR